MSTPFYIITGFLGSGKTTLLKRILDRYAEEQKIGIIQNEFAALNVDAVELKRSDKSFELLEINRGSVFCVCLVADFKTGLRDFIDAHHPDAVFLEASGLSDPIAVVEILHAPELQKRVFLAKIWSIIDASSFLTMEKINLRLTHQVRVADVAIINKKDKVDIKVIEKVQERIKRINPSAIIIQTSFCDVDASILEADEIPVAVQNRVTLASYKAQPRPDIGTAVVKSAHKITRSHLDLFLHEFAPKSYRLKGHVQLADGSTMMIQSTLGDVLLYPLEHYVGPTELIAIGPEINPREFSRRFRELIEIR